MAFLRPAFVLLLASSAAFAAPAPAASPVLCGFDVAFVVDSSALVGDKFFVAEADFIADFLAKAAEAFSTFVNPKGIQASVTLIRDAPEQVMSLAQGSSPAAIRAQVAALKEHYHPGLTNTAAALDFVATDVFKPENGDRAAYPNVVVLVSDGRPVPGSADPAKSAAALREAGATVIVVGTNDWKGHMIEEKLLSVANGVKEMFVPISAWESVLSAHSFTDPLLAANSQCSLKA